MKWVTNCDEKFSIIAASMRTMAYSEVSGSNDSNKWYLERTTTWKRAKIWKKRRNRCQKKNNE